MKKQNVALGLYWMGLLLAVSMAGIGTQSLMVNLRMLTMEELSLTIWADGGPLFIFWAMSVTLGAILVGIGAFVYVKTKPVFPWFTGFGVLAIVIIMVVMFPHIYNPALLGIGGAIILLSFFGVVWVWMKKYAGVDMQTKIAGSYKLVGYIFWINASWFLCGETAKMHLKAFENASIPSPIEIMVFLVLGWLFVLIGDYKEMWLQKNRV